jgi:DNA invertase Pin-like site-specific DNA recombinase
MVRCSSKRQRFGDTDTRQTENAKLECARRGWPWKPELIVRDLGVSAYHAMNFKPSSELGRFIEAAEKQLLLPNPVLICENPDRFSRAQIDNADGTLWRLVRYGVDVLFMSGSLYLTRGDENDAATRTRIIWEFDRSRKESQRKAFFAGATMTRKLREASEGRKVDFGTHLPVWIDFNKGPIPSYTFNEREDTLRLMVKLASPAS